jgi:hypothetical protein
MATSEALTRWNVRGYAPAATLSLRYPVSSMARRLALGVLRMLLVASMGVLLAVGVALAYAPTQGGHEEPSLHVAPALQSETAKSTAPSECAYKISIIAPVAAAFAQFRSHGFDSIPARDQPDLTDFDDDCCGVACHAAVGNVGHDGGAWCSPLAAFVLIGSSVLQGRDQGPPERPPRIA